MYSIYALVIKVCSESRYDIKQKYMNWFKHYETSQALIVNYILYNYCFADER